MLITAPLPERSNSGNAAATAKAGAFSNTDIARSHSDIELGNDKSFKGGRALLTKKEKKEGEKGRKRGRYPLFLVGVGGPG